MSISSSNNNNNNDIISTTTSSLARTTTAAAIRDTKPLIKIPLYSSNNNNIIYNKLYNKELYIFLDYDGTLTPIVSNPMDAKLSSEMGDILKKLTINNHKVSIVTGRSLNTIISFIKPVIGDDAINNIQFAASHGFDIMGPKHTHYQVGGAYLPQLSKCRDELIIESKKYPKCVIEDNKFSVSIHYRNVDPDLYLDISNMVHNIVNKYPQLKVHYGKMVYEIKLNLNWNKGQAVLWLLNAYGIHNNNDNDDDDDYYYNIENDNNNIIPIYIGDDITDEDGFRVIKSIFPNNGLGILVHNTKQDLGRPTSATYTLEDTNEVRDFLNIIANIKEDNNNNKSTTRMNNDSVDNDNNEEVVTHHLNSTTLPSTSHL